jgi:hypothetical protein
MKYLKYFESRKKDENKRAGVYVGVTDIIPLYNYLKQKNIRFIILYGKKEDDDDYNYFLILIEGNDYKKLPFVSEFGYRDYYINITDTEIFNNNVFINWFIPEEIEGNWKIINNLEEIEIILNSNKYNL